MIGTSFTGCLGRGGPEVKDKSDDTEHAAEGGGTDQAVLRAAEANKGDGHPLPPCGLDRVSAKCGGSRGAPIRGRTNLLFP